LDGLELDSDLFHRLFGLMRGTSEAGDEGGIRLVNSKFKQKNMKTRELNIDVKVKTYAL